MKRLGFHAGSILFLTGPTSSGCSQTQQVPIRHPPDRLRPHRGHPPRQGVPLLPRQAGRGLGGAPGPERLCGGAGPRGEGGRRLAAGPPAERRVPAASTLNTFSDTFLNIKIYVCPGMAASNPCRRINTFPSKFLIIFIRRYHFVSASSLGGCPTLQTSIMKSVLNIEDKGSFQLVCTCPLACMSPVCSPLNLLSCTIVFISSESFLRRCVWLC